MKIINGNDLWNKLVEMPFASKKLCDLSKQELEIFLRMTIDHVNAEDEEYGYRLVYYKGNGNLIIPWNAPPKYRYWQQELSDKEKYNLFLEMGVPESDMHFFMHEEAIRIAKDNHD